MTSGFKKTLNDYFMQRNILFYINPISGTGNKNKLENAINIRCAKEQVRWKITATNAAGDYQYLRKLIVKEKYTDIVICGGDGTISQVTAALFKTKISIGIIPMGSGNGLAFTVNIPANIDKALDVIFLNNSLWVDGFFINNKFSCMLCGLGFDAEVAHEFAKQPTRGIATYIQQSLKNFATAKPYSFELQINGELIITEAYFICIANSNQFGNNVKIAPLASLSDGLFDVVIAQKMSKPKLILSLIKHLMMGNLMKAAKKKDEHILYFQSQKVIVKNLEMAPLHIDGEPVETAAELNIENVKKAFRLLQPLAT